MEQQAGNQTNVTDKLIEQSRILISSLSIEDFDCEETLNLAWGNRDSPVLFERIKAMLRAQAKKVGMSLTAFDKIWSAFVREKTQEEQERQEGQVTKFSGQPLELKCGRYLCLDNGIYKTEPGRFGDEEICVCSHPIMPIKRLVNIETNEVQWVIAFRRGERWLNEIIDKATLSDKTSIVKTLGKFDIAVSSDNAPQLVKFLNDLMELNREIIPEEKSISRLGWVDGYGFSPYVDGLHYDSYGQFKTEFDAISQAGSWDKWREMYRSVRDSGHLAARLVFAAAAISPFVSRLGALPFFFHIWGSQSGIGKTVAIMAATSMWANPEQGLYNKTCNATDVGFEQMAAFCNHLPLILDELQELRNKSSQNFDKVIYHLCEGVERMRGAKEGGIRQTKRWRNVIITCGETPITSTSKGAGAIARVIEVESQTSLFDDAPALTAIVKENYGWAGRKIIEALSDPESGLTMEKIQKWRDRFYEQLGAKDKQAMAMSLLMTGDAILGWLVQKPEFTNLTVSQVKGFIRSQDEMNVNLDCYYYLCEWIGGNAGRFEQLTIDKDQQSERFGRWDSKNNKLVYILNRVIVQTIKDAGYDPRAFLSWAKANKLIKCNGSEAHKYGYQVRGLFNKNDRFWTIALLTGQIISRDEDVIETEDE